MASSLSSTTILLLLLSAAVLFSLLSTPAFADSILGGGDTLLTGYSLTQDAYSFTMQKDCNLVLYDDKHAIWATGTKGKGSGCLLEIQLDGNLIIYTLSKNTRSIIWQSDSILPKGYYYLSLQSDRNVVIYDQNSNPIWATGTNIDKAAVVVIPHSNNTATESNAAQNKVKELYP